MPPLFTPRTAAATYTPRDDTETNREKFLERLLVCEACPARLAQTCQKANQLCTVLARRQLERCPDHKWPGDKPPIEIKIPIKTTPFWTLAIERLTRRAVRQAAAVIAARPAAPRVSIVIAARNYARYLPEAIESALAQTVPCEVIYSDDASHDNSPDVARRYVDRGLTVIESPLQRGVASARRRGFEIARGNWFINLDGDDILPATYVAEMLKAAKPDTPFVYADAQAFGDHNTLWKAPEWGAAGSSLWLQNFVNTSALYSRTAYHAAGGWLETIGTMWDFDLALRAMRFGKPRRQSKIPLLYRQHAASFSHANQEHEERNAVTAREKIRRQHARLSVGSILSGRLPDLFPEWLDNLARGIRQIRHPHPIDLVLLDHCQRPRFTSIVRRECARHADTFDTIRILPENQTLAWKTEPERRDAVARFMAASCNRLKDALRGDLHLIVEDDILPPLTGPERLFAALTAGSRPPEAASGLYRNRHAPDRIVGGNWNNGRAHEATLPTGAHAARDWLKKTLAADCHLAADMIGTGCALYWRDAVPDFESHCQGGIPAHDWAWSLEIKRRGGYVLILPEVACAHVVDQTTTLDWL